MKKGVDYIGVGCVFYCHDGKGKILMNKRSKNCRDEVGVWDPGGGAMRVGETFEEAVRREIREEYCSEVVDLKFIAVNNVLRKNGKEKTHWVAVIFAAEVIPEKVKIGDPDKIENIGWFSLDNLPVPLHSMFHEHLKMVKKAGVL
ncbi:MAG: NUDIX domain-containing protein [Candidatus Roizmanbacteria bacterium]|nr:MAG: NUDIX domain-containing protein [Candidatus Roizmanbacteria bacterium]